MEFFIKKNSTLPILKVQIIKDGRLDFREFDNLTNSSTITFSMKDVETDMDVIVNKPAFVIKKTNTTGDGPEEDYFVYYQFTRKETRKMGRFQAEFKITNSQGEIILPLRNKLFINIDDSFSEVDLCCKPNK